MLPEQLCSWSFWHIRCGPLVFVLRPTFPAKVAMASQCEVYMQMGDLTLLPDGTVLLCNGAQVGECLLLSA